MLRKQASPRIPQKTKMLSLQNPRKCVGHSHLHPSCQQSGDLGWGVGTEQREQEREQMVPEGGPSPGNLSVPSPHHLGLLPSVPSVYRMTRQKG